MFKVAMFYFISIPPEIIRSSKEQQKFTNSLKFAYSNSKIWRRSLALIQYLPAGQSLKSFLFTEV